MKSHRILIGTILLLLLTLFACTERIEIELDSTHTRLVVNGKLSTDSLRHQVMLTTTSDYFSNQAAPTVSGALVEISSGDSTMILQEQDSVPGLYLTPEAFRGVIGATYKLSISRVDVNRDGEEESYESTATMPGGLVLDSIRLEYLDVFFVSGYQVFMYAKDPPGRNWYNLKFRKNSDMLTDTLIKYSIQSDEFYDDSYLFYEIPIGFYNDEDPRELLLPGDTACLEVHCIEQAYYNFISDAQLEVYGSNPLFSGPPANMRSNISNGAIGMFAVYSIERSSVIIP